MRALDIEIDRVIEVLLADRWHVVVRGSFTVAPYNFQHTQEDRPSAEVIHRHGEGGVPGAGFRFTELAGGSETDYAGPLTSILALKLAR